MNKLNYNYREPSLRCIFVDAKIHNIFTPIESLNKMVEEKLNELESNDCTVVDIEYIPTTEIETPLILIKYYKNV